MNFNKYKLSNVVTRLVATICLLTFVLPLTSGAITAPPKFVNFTKRVIQSDSCVDSIKQIGDGKYSQVCLGDNATENYACNPLETWEKGNFLYLSDAEKAVPNWIKQHESLGYYCGSKTK